MSRTENRRRPGCSDSIQIVKISSFLRQTGSLLVAICIAACSGKQTVFVPAPQSVDDYSVVYIYRPSSTANFMMSPTVVVNANEQFRIGNGGYRYIYLPAGRHELGLNPTDQYTTGAAVTLSVQANNSYYLRVNTSLRFEPDSMNTRRFWIEQVSGQMAVDEIAAAEYSGPGSQTMLEQSDESVEIEGFTIDRTRDPFSDKD